MASVFEMSAQSLTEALGLQRRGGDTAPYHDCEGRARCPHRADCASIGSFVTGNHCGVHSATVT